MIEEVDKENEVIKFKWKLIATPQVTTKVQLDNASLKKRF